jgi:hypothetical protein
MKGSTEVPASAVRDEVSPKLQADKTACGSGATPRLVNTPLACLSGPAGEGLNDRGSSTRVARAASAYEPDGVDQEPRFLVRGGPVRANANMHRED